MVIHVQHGDLLRLALQEHDELRGATGAASDTRAEGSVRKELKTQALNEHAAIAQLYRSLLTDMR